MEENMLTTFNSTGLAESAGNVTVFNYDPLSGEYEGESDEYLAEGVGIPANSTLIVPPDEETGKARVFSDGAWALVSDHRGEQVYHTADGSVVTISQLGEYPEGTTVEAPGTVYDKWDGAKWVTDADAQKAAEVSAAESKRNLLISLANDFMNSKQWPGKAAMGRLTDTEKSLYNTWLDYLDALNAVDTTTAPDITWPQTPA